MKRIFLSMALLVGAVCGSAWAQNASQNPGQGPGQNLGQNLSPGPGQDAGQNAAAQVINQLQEEPQSGAVSVFVLGTVEVVGGKVSIRVQTARETNGAGMKDLIGKSLHVTGKKIQRLEQMAKKQVELRGLVKEGAEFEVLSYTERRTPTAAESASVQGAHGPVGVPLGALNARGPRELPSASGNRTPIGALNDPKGAGVNKPNTGAIGTLQGRRKPIEPEMTPDTNLPAVAVTGLVR